MYSTRVGLAHALGRATLLQADGAFRREAVDSKAYSWREFIVGASATRELPRGFVVTAGSTYRLRRYDRPIAAFGPEARQDRHWPGRMKVSNRHIELFGFMPELTISHERRRSNLSLYDYKRKPGRSRGGSALLDILDMPMRGFGILVLMRTRGEARSAAG